MMPRLLLIVAFVILCACEREDTAPAPREKQTAFAFGMQLTLPGNADAIYDSITGDISGWWDHKFSENPAKFYIDPRPGGGFYEIFDESGDGVLHATVIYAQRGKLLRLDGPLGLSGKAVNMVYTLSFEPAGTDSTILSLEVHGSGEFEPTIPGLVESVWKHFLFDRFKPYVEGRLQE
jgi:hypothetical protein